MKRSQKERAMGVEPLAPSWSPQLMGRLSLLGTPPRKQMLTLENLMRQAVRTMPMQELKMPGLWARRLAEDEVVERDVVPPEMLEPDVVICIHEADVVEGLDLMSKVMSKSYLVAREGRCGDDALADALLLFPKMSG